jgi:putative endonuclease
MTSTWSVYVLLCQGNTLYTGISPNPEQRFLLHKTGKGAKYTRAHPPLKIVHQEQHADRSAASKREAEIKKWSRSQKIARLKIEI